MQSGKRLISRICIYTHRPFKIWYRPAVIKAILSRCRVTRRYRQDDMRKILHCQFLWSHGRYGIRAQSRVLSQIREKKKSFRYGESFGGRTFFHHSSYTTLRSIFMSVFFIHTYVHIYVYSRKILLIRDSSENAFYWEIVPTIPMKVRNNFVARGRRLLGQIRLADCQIIE